MKPVSTAFAATPAIVVREPNALPLDIDPSVGVQKERWEIHRSSVCPLDAELIRNVEILKCVFRALVSIHVWLMILVGLMLNAILNSISQIAGKFHCKNDQAQ